MNELFPERYERVMRYSAEVFVRCAGERREECRVGAFLESAIPTHEARYHLPHTDTVE